MITPQYKEEVATPATFAGYGGGHAALTGSKLKLYRVLDRLFLSWAEQWHAQEYRFPAVLPARELNKIGYFKSFPQHMTLPVGLAADHDNLSEFTAHEPLDADGAVRLTHCAPAKDVLTPAACYHFYVNFQNDVLNAARFVTTKATCFRQEARYTPLHRQWSFSMREVVCLGTAAEVTQYLEAFRRTLERFFHSIDLPIKWETATDPFFNPQNNPKYILQKLDPVKTEMVFEGELAIGSVNFHRNYFGEAFRISRAGEDAFSGCVAFGLDRWVYAFLKRFGDREDRWPNLKNWE